ncbi:glycoside hydrolase family 3 protein [Megamonas funiformis]|uniref:glycoside hydrolase family 3 protein n=2 Tax=Megamonas funiformis TaxID=437897 RepID=UPI00216B395E|nr:glycoside hydrolase family 3 N-terminal domain-containing protein [Megamonas funiformis]
MERIVMHRKIVFSIIIIGIVFTGILLSNKYLFNINEETSTEVFYSDAKQNLTIDEKVDKIVASMSLSEKIGQMVMIGVHGTDITDDSAYMLNQYHIGGIILFDRNMRSIEQVKTFTNNLQKNANQKIPLFIGIDEEGGNVVRMKNALTPPPSQYEIGITNDTEQAKKWAIKTSQSLKEMGININFAPVADVNSNDTRSYSGDHNVVTAFVKAAATGYEHENMIYSLKHFPGIGKGKVDSHFESSMIDASKDILLSDDIIPFKTIIKENNPENYFILISHLTYTDLDNEKPASLSKKIITDLLRKELGFSGIIITDDMEMGAIANHNDFRTVGVKAVKAGVDIVMVCHEYEHETDVYLGLLDAVNNGEISLDRIDESVKRIVRAKLLHLM